MIGAFVTGFGFCTGGRRVAVVELCAAAAAVLLELDPANKLVDGLGVDRVLKTELVGQESGI